RSSSPPRHSDTHVEYILDTETWLGPYGETPYELAEEVAALIVSSGLNALAFPDLRPAQWSKLIFNATVNAVAALTGLPHDHHFAEREHPGDLGNLVYGLVEEGKRVADASGVELHEDAWEMNVLATRRGSRHYPSTPEAVEAIAALAGTTGSHAAPAAKKNVVIGWAYDKAGQMAPFDNPALAAAGIRVKQINAKSGKYHFVIKTCDTQNNNAAKAKACALSLLGQHASIIFTTCDVDFATPVVQEAINHGKLAIAPCIGTDQMGP